MATSYRPPECNICSYQQARPETPMPIYHRHSSSRQIRKMQGVEYDRSNPQYFCPTCMVYRKTLKPSLASEGTLPTNYGLLGCKLEAVHACDIPRLESVYSKIYPQTQLPLPNTQFSLLQASKENAEEHSNQFRFIVCTQANS